MVMGGLGPGGGEGVGAGSATSLWPQLPQKKAPSSTGVPHCGQTPSAGGAMVMGGLGLGGGEGVGVGSATSLWPQLPQKRAPSSAGAPHCGQTPSAGGAVRGGSASTHSPSWKTYHWPVLASIVHQHPCSSCRDSFSTSIRNSSSLSFPAACFPLSS